MPGHGTEASILDCPICTNILEEPRILPCQHTICEKCLSIYIKDIIRKEGERPPEFPCPVCTRKTRLKDASSFQKNLTIVALLDSKSLSAKLQKASAKKKTKAVTIETQTREEETFMEPNNVPVATFKTLTPQDVKNTEDQNRRRNKATNVVDRENTMHDPKIVEETLINRATVIHVEMINGIFLENVATIYVLLVFDLVLIMVAFYMPFLISLIITYDLFCNYSRRSFLLSQLSQKGVIERKKWWHVYLFINIEWAVCTIVSVFWLILFVFLVSLFYTFYSAISNKESVFTFNVLMENFALRLISLVYAAYSLNLDLTDKFRRILHWLF